MKKIALMTVMPLLMAALSTGQAKAITFTETDDAGETISTAEIIPAGTQILESISGMVSGDADLFQLFLTGGQAFSATTINLETLIEVPIDDLLGTPSELLADPQLFLFDSSGKGVYGNDDSFGSPQATLPSGGFSPTESGLYYLAISSSGYNPVSAGGRIFSDELSDGVFTPTGSGGASSLSGFEGSSPSSWRYTIALTGAQAGAATGAERVPEPSSMLSILALGALGTVHHLKNKKNKKKVISG